MRIAPATERDIHHAGELRAAMAKEHNVGWDDTNPGWRARFVEYFSDEMERENALVLFAWENDAVVGMAIFSFVHDYRAYALAQRRGYVNGVYVLPQFRRRGIARAMMSDGIAWLRTGGAKTIRLRSSDEGRPLYASLGFVPSAEMAGKVVIDP